MQWLEYFEGWLQYHGRHTATLFGRDGAVRLLVKSVPMGVEAETTHVYDARIFLEDFLCLRSGELVRIEGSIVDGKSGPAVHVINACRLG